MSCQKCDIMQLNWKFFFHLQLLYKGLITPFLRDRLYIIMQSHPSSRNCRNLKKHAVLKEFAPRNLFALFIDVLTLMPIFEIIDLVLRASYGDIHVIYKKNEIKMKVVGRLYRVYLFFWKLKTTAGLNQILIVISLHLVTYLVIVQSVAAVWYDIRCWMCPYSTWIINLVNHRIDFYSPIEWWTICFCKITTVFAHKSSGD